MKHWSGFTRDMILFILNSSIYPFIFLECRVRNIWNYKKKEKTWLQYLLTPIGSNEVFQLPQWRVEWWRGGGKSTIIRWRRRRFFSPSYSFCLSDKRKRYVNPATICKWDWKIEILLVKQLYTIQYSPH